MRRTIAAFIISSLLLSAESMPPTIKSVTVHGAQIKVDLATQVGRPYNAEIVDRDVHHLWDTGRFADIRVETSQDADGMNVLFTVIQAPARKLASSPASASGNRIHVRSVDFVGEPGLDSKQLHQALGALKIHRIIPGVPGLWPGWRMLPTYSREAVDADVARLRSLYLSQGYFDATVRIDHTDLQKNAAVTFFVRSGVKYTPRQSIPQLCSSLLSQRRDAEHQGILDFSVMIHVRRLDNRSNAVDLFPAIDRGPAYRVGRIDFRGNRHYSDAMLRRNMLLDEGQLLDQAMLRASAGRINQTGLFEPIRATDISIRSNRSRAIADISLQLAERKRGAWNFSGPVGPATFGGPLEATISTHLPPWRRGLLELSTYTASVSLIAFAHPLLPALAMFPRHRLVPVVALARPFTPGDGWKSGLAIVPQLGWRASVLIYFTTQIQQRLMPRLSVDREPALPVTVDGPNQEGILFCETPAPRLLPLRNAASLSLRFLGALTGL